MIVPAHMEDPNYYLGEGKYTSRDDHVKNSLAFILKLKNRESPAGKISYYLFNFLGHQPFSEDVFRKRTASQIISSGFSTGCTDDAIVFCALAREAGIPAKYIETLNKKNLHDRPRKVEGHVFAEIFIDDRWRVYEPLQGFSSIEGFWLGEDEYLKVGEGLDFSSLITPQGQIFDLDTVPKIKAIRDSFALSA
jgi:hypothetical protein